MLHNLVFAVAVLFCLILPEKMISLFLLTSQKSFDQFNQKELIVTVDKVFVELSKVSFD